MRVSLRDVPGFAFTAARLFGIQSAFSYERMLGIGFGHAIEPLLRPLRGQGDGSRYHEALARESRFFNSHPYLASLAIGAAARSELEGVSGERIERLRSALCGPLGALGDRLVWAGWLPACVGLGLALATRGAGGWAVAAFLVLYNVVHVLLRIWGLRAGWMVGLRVSVALSHPVLKRGLAVVGPLAAVSVGAALPMVLGWAVRLGGPSDPTWIGLSGAAAGTLVFLGAARLVGTRLSGLVLAIAVLGAAALGGALWP